MSLICFSGEDETSILRTEYRQAVILAEKCKFRQNLTDIDGIVQDTEIL